MPYLYVIRDKVPPPALNALMEELIHLLPVMEELIHLLPLMEELIHLLPVMEDLIHLLPVTEELIYLLLVDMANAQLRADSISGYLYLESVSKAGTAKPLMQH